MQEAIPTLVPVAENGKDKLVLPANDLLFIVASDNYCTVFHLAGDRVAKTLLCSPLGRLESQINLPRVIRCHRSYMVNLDRVQSVTGNAQGYKLFFAAAGMAVPVARTYSPFIKAHFFPV
jgi:DNA-binding LytR/AlgR family response regulator